MAYLIDALGRGGAETLLPIFLAHLDRERFEPHVAALATREGNPVADRIAALGVPVEVLGVRRLFAPGNVNIVQSYLQRNAIDLVHSPIYFAATLGALAARRLNVPAVATFHTVDRLPPWNRTFWRNKLIHRILRQYCDRAIAVSHHVRAFHLRAGLPAGAIDTIHNGIDLSRFGELDDRARCATREALGIARDAPVIATVCVLRPAKGVQHLIAAMPAMLQSHPRLRLVIVGAGEHEAALRAVSQARGVADDVIFAGHRDDVPWLLSAADLFVLPTLADALPTVLIEAMAARRAIVATRVGGIPEMIEHERNGLLVPPGDEAALAAACSRLLADPDAAADMARRGRAVAEERFDLRVQMQRTCALYDELLGTPTHRGRPSMQVQQV